MKKVLLSVASAMLLLGCNANKSIVKKTVLTPAVITEQTPNDTDDPALWIHPTDYSKSLIIGTDKHKKDGGLYAFDLNGKIQNVVENLDRPNNVDVIQNITLGDRKVDIAVVTERKKKRIRIFELPSLKPLDRGGLPVFEDSENRAPMGVALYQNPENKKVYVIVGRKKGPEKGYLYQYELIGKGSTFSTKFVRKFGNFSGKKEIEAICVDQENGFVYYSDEQFGVRKYYADPAKGDKELALFGTTDFLSDLEGIAIYKTNDKQGYIIISNQQANTINIYSREVEAEQKPKLLAKIPVSAIECDGLEATSLPLSPQFPKGVLVMMSNGKVFHIYDWRTIEKHLEN